MKIILSLTLLLLLIVIVALVTCPDQSSFEKHLDSISQPAGKGLLEKASAAIHRIQADLTVEYHDHKLWATGRAKIGGRDLRFLGILGNWFLLDSGKS